MQSSRTTVAASKAHGGGRLPFLDGWRGAAVLAVIAGHFYGIKQYAMGELGVELFFVLSGRLMADILFAQPVDLRTFFIRRASRVWPGYFVFVIVTGAAFSALVHPAPDISNYLSAAVFLSNYDMIYSGRAPVFDHLWSLSVEEWSYVYLAVIVILWRALPRIKPIVWLAISAVVFAINACVMSESGAVMSYYRTDTRITSILISAVVYLATRRVQVPSFVPVVAGLAALPLFAAIIPDPIQFTVGTALLALAVSTIDQSPALIRTSLLSSRIMTQVGVWSFSLYLWQQPFYKLVDKDVGIHLTRWVAMPAALVAALLSFYLIESPARKFLNKRFASRGEGPIHKTPSGG